MNELKLNCYSSMDRPEVIYNEFRSIFNKVYNEARFSVDRSVKNKNHIKKPWMNKELIKRINERNKKYKRAKDSEGNRAYKKFKNK